MRAEEDAVAIAAPQIGVSLRIFIVAGKVFVYQKSGSVEEGAEEKEKKDGVPPLHQDVVFINPELIKRSQKKQWVEEGCLSVRWLYGEVKRSERTTVRAYDENGKQFTRGASGILAQIFEHETEHLDGVLFIDKARDIKEAPPLEKK